jgi:hypothetical protein
MGRRLLRAFILVIIIIICYNLYFYFSLFCPWMCICVFIFIHVHLCIVHASALTLRQAQRRLCYLPRALACGRGGLARLEEEPRQGGSEVSRLLVLCSLQHDHNRIRCRDLFYGLWVPDLFIKRVETNDQVRGKGDDCSFVLICCVIQFLLSFLFNWRCFVCVCVCSLACLFLFVFLCG